MTKLTPFHLAIPVKNLVESRQFYGELMGCQEGRSSEKWVDFDFFGHQLVCHVIDDLRHNNPVTNCNPVDSHQVPIPHFGVVLEMVDWLKLRDKLLDYNVKFVIEPYIRFKGKKGEQATMFFYDPSGNALEFKSFKNIKEELFKNS